MATKAKSKNAGVDIAVRDASDVAPRDNETVVWRPNSDKQTAALQAEDFEIFFGGAKGGGKSFCGIGWLISGNQRVRGEVTPTDVTYINNPLYRGLALRRNHVDLKDWIDKAKAVYGKLGADFVDDEFRFPTGAKIRTGHLAEEDSYTRYFGHEVHRVFIDELTFIPKYDLYRKIRSCLRSTVPGIRPQMFATGNPGGPGGRWVKDYFITPKGKNGKVIPPMTPIGSRFYNPLLGKEVLITRIYIPSRVTDNSDLINADPMYLSRLMMGSEAERRAYIEGDWDALAGQYFGDFRPNGPLAGEEQFPQARHVYNADSVELLPYWHRWIGMDWGFAHESAVFWACQHPNSQVHIYRELVVSKVGAEELGALIARESMPDLQGVPSHSMTLTLSPDAFARKDDVNTIAEQVANGIARILGKDSVFLVDFTEQEKAMPTAAAWESLNRRRAQVAHQTNITIERANNERIAGWMHVREYLRFKPIQSIKNTTVDWKLVEALQSTQGVMAAAGYLNAMASQKNEILPKLQISDACPRLIRGLSEAQHDETRPEDVMKNDFDNEVDAVRYLLMADRSRQNVKPLQQYVNETVAALVPATASEHSKVMAAQHAAGQYAKSQHPFKGLILPRATGRHKRAGGVFVH